MAVSNAIGSNVFDINFGLGIPFIIRIIIDLGKPIAILDEQEQASNSCQYINPVLMNDFLCGK